MNHSADFFADNWTNVMDFLVTKINQHWNLVQYPDGGGIGLRCYKYFLSPGNT